MLFDGAIKMIYTVIEDYGQCEKGLLECGCRWLACDRWIHDSSCEKTRQNKERLNRHSLTNSDIYTICMLLIYEHFLYKILI